MRVYLAFVSSARKSKALKLCISGLTQGQLPPSPLVPALSGTILSFRLTSLEPAPPTQSRLSHTSASEARRFTAALSYVSASMEVEGLEPGAAEPGPLEGSDQKLEAEEEQEESEEAAGGSKKRVVPGIVYLGHIPPRFRPLHVRNLLSAYGEVGRVFFQAEGKCSGLDGEGRGVVLVGTEYTVRVLLPQLSLEALTEPGTCVCFLW